LLRASQQAVRRPVHRARLPRVRSPTSSGVYEYAHPLTDAVAYKERLSRGDDLATVAKAAGVDVA
jgi:hypothetical protein